MNLWQIFINVVVKGKAKRLPRGLYFIYLVIGIVAYYGLGALMIGIESLAGGGIPFFSTFLSLVLGAALIGYTVLSFKLMFLRLHDTNRSGAYWFIGFIPFVGTFLLLFTLFLEPGTNGRNDYGMPFHYGRKKDPSI